MNQKLNELQNAFDQALNNLTEAFEGLKTEIIRVEKPKFKTEKRAAEIGDRILITNPEDDSAGAVGEVFTVIDVGSMGSVDVKEIMVNGNHYAFTEDEYEVIIEPEQVPIIQEQPETIEHEGLLLRKVNRACKENDYVRVQHEDGKCFKPNKLYGPVRSGVVEADSSTEYNEFEKAEVYNEFYGRDENTVEVFEVVKALVKELTPNEQRDELIKWAKLFWDENADEDFHAEVDEEKRTVFVYKVIADKNGGYGTITGLSVCHPNDVFNEFIGLAIALARALEIDIPEEFLHAVQPTEIIEGMEILMLWEGEKYKSGIVGSYDSLKDRGRFTNEKIFDEGAEITGYCNGVKRDGFKIINDTHAVYANGTQ